MGGVVALGRDADIIAQAQASVAVFFSRFFIVWEIKYIIGVINHEILKRLSNDVSRPCTYV